jgi:spore germination protein (amino acid permease)
MIKEGKIGVQEAVSLITITISVKVYFTSPAYVARYVGTASWYMSIVSAIVTIIGFTILYKLMKRFSGKDLIGAFEQSLGRKLGFIFSMAIASLLLINSALILREFAEVLKVYSLPLTPPSFVIGMLLAVTVIACFLGLESIARAARLLAYFLLGGFLVVIVLAWNNYDFKNLFPILGNGVDKTIIHGFMRSSFYGEVIALSIISSSLQGLSHFKKTGYISIIISGLITSSALLASMMAFNYSVAQEIISRIYELSRVIKIGGFLQRLDPFFLFTWCIGTIVSVSFLLYCSMSSYCKSFRIKDMKPLVIPSAIILFSISMIPKDFIEVMSYTSIIRQYGWTIYFGLPLITLIIALIRKKKEVSKSA